MLSVLILAEQSKWVILKKEDRSSFLIHAVIIVSINLDAETNEKLFEHSMNNATQHDMPCWML